MGEGMEIARNYELDCLLFVLVFYTGWLLTHACDHFMRHSDLRHTTPRSDTCVQTKENAAGLTVSPSTSQPVDASQQSERG